MLKSQSIKRAAAPKSKAMKRQVKTPKKAKKTSKRTMSACPFSKKTSPFSEENLPPRPASMTAEEMAIVKSCVPILETGGEALTTHFYNLMLGEQSIVRPFFNPTHQMEKSQPRALAFSVLCVAKHIDNLGPVLASPFGKQLIDTIVKKHLAVNVRAEHYPIVGNYLLRASREVLGPEVATDQVISAWGKAYGVLSDLLIRLEAQGYTELMELPGGWEGQRPFTVVGKEFANNEKTAISYTVKPVDGKPAICPKPGQYLTLRLQDEANNINTTRNYSISDIVDVDGSSYRFTTQVVEKGVVTNYLNSHIKVGSQLHLHPPTGEFTLRNDTLSGPNKAKPVTFIAAGAGITPFISMAKSLRKSNPEQEISLLTVAENNNREVLAADVDALGASGVKVAKLYAHKTQLSADDINTPTESFVKFLKDHKVDQTPSGNVYIVGPPGFMKTTHNALTKNLKMDAAGLNYEFFGPHTFF